MAPSIDRVHPQISSDDLLVEHQNPEKIEASVKRKSRIEHTEYDRSLVDILDSLGIVVTYIRN